MSGSFLYVAFSFGLYWTYLLQWRWFVLLLLYWLSKRCLYRLNYWCWPWPSASICANILHALGLVIPSPLHGIHRSTRKAKLVRIVCIVGFLRPVWFLCFPDLGCIRHIVRLSLKNGPSSSTTRNALLAAYVEELYSYVTANCDFSLKWMLQSDSHAFVSWFMI